MRQLALADRGQSLSLDKSLDDATPICLSVARLGSLQTAGSCFTVWIQVRGSAWVEAKEGRFRLRRGEWSRECEQCDEAELAETASAVFVAVRHCVPSQETGQS